MKKIIISTVMLGSMSNALLLASEKNDQNLSVISSEIVTGTKNIPTASRGEHNVQSVREILSGYNPLEHSVFQIRAGYISFDEDGLTGTDAYALGGHLHLNTKEWNGLKLGAEGLTVLDLGINQNPVTFNPDFFDANGNSFIILSQAYLGGKWENTEIKLGRQSLDTPHADTDDIRMMPNYFLAYTASNSDIEGLKLSVAKIEEMAGWENGIDSSHFVDVYETLGAPTNTNGIYYASALYEGIKDLSLSLWYYDYVDITTIWYAEAGYSYTFSDTFSLSVGLQYDKAGDSEDALLGGIDSNTFGMNFKAKFEKIGITLLGAYNKDDGDTGAAGLSLGGGPFFTSMEDLTLDAIGAAGSAWIIGAGYDCEKIGVAGLALGLAYGNFEAEDASLFESSEIDAVLEYTVSEKLSVTAAFASIQFENETGIDFTQLRLIANYNF